MIARLARMRSAPLANLRLLGALRVDRLDRVASAGRPRISFFSIFGLLSLGLALASLSGCATARNASDLAVRPYEPENVFRFSGQFPKEVKRLGVLPVVFDRASYREQGEEVLPNALMTELGKTGAFELYRISPEQLESLTGEPEWSAEEPLPEHFFKKLDEAFGVDAVLFSRVTRYRPFPPMTIGWHMKLIVAGKKPLILWSADEVFDCSDPAVAKSARFHNAGPFPWMPPEDGDMSLLSPRRFGQFTVGALFATLPAR